MATVLLVIIYIAFIGLGVPDSLFGTAWPAIYTEYGLPFSFASFASVITCCGTVLSSVFSARIIARFGTGRVSAFSTLLTAAALAGYGLSGNYVFMCLCAVPLGIGAGAIDVALNNYVSLHYSATHMSFLHCFYGVGVTLSPYIMSRVINGKLGWRGGYAIAFGIQILITAMLFITLPVWKKAHGNDAVTDENAPKTLTFRETLKIPGVKLMCALFITSCTIEWACGGWGSTYLVEHKKVSADTAAAIIAFYYLGLTLGRFLSGVLAARLHSWKIIKIGLFILASALAILLIPGSPYISAVGLFLVGLGNGPMFPNYNYLAPESFGAEISRSVIGVQMAAAYIGIMLAPMICGLIGQAVGMWIFPYYLLIFFAIMLYSTVKVKKVLGVKS